MRILAAIDGSAFSEEVIDTVIAQAKAPGTEVQVLHVLERLPALQHGALVWESITDEQRAIGRHLVYSAAERLRSAGIQVTTLIREGKAKSIIVDTADQWLADLIMVGSHGFGWVERFLLGSVSEAVARHAHCSVQIVRVRKAEVQEPPQSIPA